MPVYQYLDLTTAHLTEAEMDAVEHGFHELDEDTPRVIVHDYGAWLNVQPDECRDANAERALAAAYPNVVACLARARALGCSWINFDRDAEYDDVLPTYEW